MIACGMFAVAIAWTVAWVGWSEDFLKTETLGNVLIRTAPWVTVAGICGAVVCAWRIGRKCGSAVALLAILAFLLLYWPRLGFPTYGYAISQGTLTAGNSSPLTDGAAAIWVGSEAGMAKLPADTPKVRLVDYEMAKITAENPNSPNMLPWEIMVRIWRKLGGRGDRTDTVLISRHKPVVRSRPT